MSTMVILMAISVFGASLLFIALAIYLGLIIRELEAIGGTPTSYLAKIRLGVRAIETETGALAPQVTRLNEGLGRIRDGMSGIDDNLGGLIEAVTRQEAP